jgi:hypothetical protein
MRPIAVMLLMLTGCGEPDGARDGCDARTSHGVCIRYNGSELATSDVEYSIDLTIDAFLAAYEPFYKFTREQVVDAINQPQLSIDVVDRLDEDHRLRGETRGRHIRLRHSGCVASTALVHQLQHELGFVMGLGMDYEHVDPRRFGSDEWPDWANAAASEVVATQETFNYFCPAGQVNHVGRLTPDDSCGAPYKEVW